MPDVKTQLDRIEDRLTRVEQKIDNVTILQRATLSEGFLMATNLDTLIAKVTDLETVQDGTVTLLGTLAQMIRDNSTDQVALLALATRIDTDKQKLADAIVANTPPITPPTP